MKKLTLLTLTFALQGCSLMGLADLQLKRCESDDDCAVFNTLDGVEPGCNAYFCDVQTGTCERHPEGAEAADSRDNDCDGLIDEPSPTGQTLAPASSREVASELGAGVTVGYGVDPDGTMAVAWWNDGDAFFARVTDSTVTGASMSYLRGAAEPPNTPDLRDIDLEAGCYKWTATGVVEGTCDFAEVAIDLTLPGGDEGQRDRVLVASVNGEGCAAGQLRVGSFARGEAGSTAAEVELRGPLWRSNSYLGIDLNESGNCTGGSRDGCTTGASAPCGAARPALAALESDPIQALVGYLGDANGRDECGGSPAGVEVVAIYDQYEQFGEFYHWVTASGEAVPEVVGQTVGGGAPAIVALGVEGYLVGHGDADGRLALHVVPAAAEPAGFTPHECPAATPDCEGSRTGRETAPLEPAESFDPIDVGGAGPVDHVALALGAQRGDQLELGVAWREGCGSGDEAIFFRRVVLDAPGGLPEGVADAGEAHQLSAELSGDGARVGPPALVYTVAPFVVEGFTRGGAGPATTDTDGGWVVAWAARADADADGLLLARRVCELDGAPLDAAELVDLTGDGTEASPEHGRPELVARGNGGVIEFAYHDPGGHAIAGGTLSLGE